jgi:hypothetical protein
VTRRAALGIAAVAAVALVAWGLASVLVLGADPAAERPLSQGDPAACRGLPGDEGKACYVRELSAMVRGRDDPRPVVRSIAAQAWAEGGPLLSWCHGVMHTVGRRYAGEAGVRLATLMDALPKGNDPACTAGFAHGLVTAVAGDVDPSRSDDAARACGDAATRYQRYSCIHGFGHAFMRSSGDLAPALDLCRGLGEQAPDCAQGAYHDYWFAALGIDEARLASEPETNPRVLCGDQPPAFVRPCWYRAFVENRPEGFVAATPEDLDGLCGGLRGLQRSACITAASVIGPPDPAEQLVLCSGLRSTADQESCVRGTKAQNLLDASEREHVRLIRGCARFRRAGPRSACYEWLGTTLAVLTDGAFARGGCPQLRGAAARRACAAGAARMEDALVTFS